MQEKDNENRKINTALEESFKNSFSSEVTSVLCNLGEIGLDTILESTIVREVPILSTVVSLYNIGNTFSERHQIYKLAAFIDEINLDKADAKKIEKHKECISTDKKHLSRELEYILLIIDSYKNEEKARMLGKLYIAYLDDRISWMTFTKYAEVIDRFLPGDYDVLAKSTAFKTEYDLETDALQRLIASGLVIEGFREIATQEEDGTLNIDPPELRERNIRNYTRTTFGNKLVEILEAQ